MYDNLFENKTVNNTLNKNLYLLNKNQNNLYAQKYLKDKILSKTFKIKNDRNNIPKNPNTNSKQLLESLKTTGVMNSKHMYMKTEPDEETSEDEKFLKASTSSLKRESNRSNESSMIKVNKKFHINYEICMKKLFKKSLSIKNTKNTSLKEEKKILNDSHTLLEDIPIEMRNNQIPYEYLTDIFENLHQEELVIKVDPNYMDKQKDINEKMRAVVINWIIEVHYRFKLFPETLFLCVNLLDRYLSNKIISRNKLQLLGVVSLLVACKYEEIFSPEIRDFVCILDKSYEQEDIIAMEKDLLKILKFDVTVPTYLKFFEILSIKFKLNKKEFFFGKYILELSLLDYNMNKYLPSIVACSACYIAITTFNKEEKVKFNKLFFKMINYKEHEIIDCSMDLCFLFENIDDSDYPAVKKKYLSKSSMEVSNLKICK